MGNENELGEENREGIVVWKLGTGGWNRGVMIGGDGRMEEEIRSRIGKVAWVIGVFNEPIWKREELSRRTKLRV